MGWGGSFPILAASRIQALPIGQGETLRGHRAMQCTCGISALIVGLGLYSYYVRELLASLVLFTGAFFVLGLVALVMYLLWCAGEKLAKWTPTASRNMIVFS